MRKVVVNNIVSLDGHYAASDGNPLVLDMDAAFDRENLAAIERADIVLLGRESFDGFSSYWPFIADAPPPEDPAAPEARAVDDVNRAISRRYNSVPKVVVSDRGPIESTNAWFDTTTALARADVVAWVARERHNGSGDILVFASHVLWNHLLAAHCVDELHLMISPHALGRGIPLFTTEAHLGLIGTRTFEDSSNVQLRYTTS